MSQTPPPSSVQHLVLGWFSMVLGLCGLSLAWHRAIPFLGDLAWWVSLCMGVLAGAVFGCLLLATGWRAWRYPSAVREDLAHPVRHVFVAAVPTSFVLVATVMVTLWGPNALADGLWMLGSATLLAATVWVAQRWLHLGRSPTAFWPAMTPALFIPVVGNVLPPLAGVTLGHEVWSAAQFGVATLLWPVALTLVLVRIGMVGLWPERLLATTFITIAPPALVGLSGSVLGMPLLLVHMAWGVALFFTLWSLSVFRRSVSQPFGVAFWGMSFPLSGFAALSLRLVPDVWWAQALALACLGCVSLVIGLLLWWTVQGLRQGRLLQAEPAPTALPG
ncbi:MAG: C4-dicarboxylate ABC transporter [Limnohabitans sp.]